MVRGGYELNERSVLWARKRVQQIDECETDVGYALERLGSVPSNLRYGAQYLEDQPESDVISAIADDVEKLVEDLTARFNGLKRDRGKLRSAIHRWEGNRMTDAPWITETERDGVPEEKLPTCPFCKREAERFYYSINGTGVLGCEHCIIVKDSWEGGD